MRYFQASILILLLVNTSILGEEPKTFGRASAYEMEAGDVLKIDFASNGCFHNEHYELVLTRTDKGVSATGANLSDYWDEKTEKVVEGKRRELQSVSLTDKQLARLDLSFEYIRANTRGGCTTIDDFSLTHFRDGKAIAQEVLRDSTCQLSDDKERMSLYELIGLITPKTKK